MASVIGAAVVLAVGVAAFLLLLLGLDVAILIKLRSSIPQEPLWETHPHVDALDGT
ncbi:hypothetical protein [Mycolicibacterium litorale]|uniref:Uncharacterized protein n=1 Tax=Mycolicibacterium litorale TaxID=758802 RepID=A0AAD1IPY3_9MYCO|nr:hypothetical protein [Mycolicibacterium litorale]MCV7418127.1 hypothetical protein [Mycolicibacterium litorale]TDY06485.1 hypothetical protein BCL50_2810 [Mycolicibacterium litorale]BBY19370.1 hypothetical protein MLIT_49620 [Mycolicibacterium litorale]